MKRVTVSLNDRSYDVVIGSGARHTLAVEIGRCAPFAQRVVIVTQPSVVAAGWLEGIETGLAQSVIEIGEGEDEKSLSTIQSLCSQFVEAGLSRNDRPSPGDAAARPNRVQRRQPHAGATRHLAIRPGS